LMLIRILLLYPDLLLGLVDLDPYQDQTS
jgi:hypothetical protein